MNKIRKFQSNLAKISLSLAAVGMTTIAGAVTFSVICRFIGVSAMWIEMYTRFMLIWVVFIASNVLIYRNELMRVDFLDSLWPKRFLKVREACYTMLFIIILALLTWTGLQQAVSYWGVAVVGFPIDKFWVYLSIPVGSFLMLVQYLLNLLVVFQDKKGGEQV